MTIQKKIKKSFFFLIGVGIIESAERHGGLFHRAQLV